MHRGADESPVTKKVEEAMEEDENKIQMQLELDNMKKLLESSLEREKVLERELERERMELEKKEQAKDRDFREFLLLSNNDILQMTCKMRDTDDPFGILAAEMAAIRREMGDDDEISLSGLCLSNESNCEVDGSDEEYFPFTDLPDEMISHTFSFMSMEDRLRARVNKRLNEIELKTKYHVDEMRIVEISEILSEFKICCCKCRPTHHMCFIEDQSDSLDCIKRLTQNVSIGLLDIYMTGCSDFHRELYNLLKDFDIGRLVLRRNDDLESILVNSFVLDLTRTCKELIISWSRLTPGGLHQVYKGMIEGSSKLLFFKLRISIDDMIPFLDLIGIQFEHDNDFFSDRNIETLRCIGGDSEWFYLFDGNLEIGIDSDLLYDDFGCFTLKLHESRESLEEAKNRERYVRAHLTPKGWTPLLPVHMASPIINNCRSISISNNRSCKIGGLLVSAKSRQDGIEFAIGIGINVSNPLPTTCLNDMLPENSSESAKFSIEEVIAMTLNKFEYFVNIYENKGQSAFLAHYYKYWLHSREEVTLDNENEKVVIRGLDKYGFLECSSRKTPSKLYSVADDGNTFDMMKGLIRMKI